MKNFYPEQYLKDSELTIKHNYLKEQFSDYQEIFKKIEQVVLENDFTLGKAVDQFEENFAEAVGAKYAIGVGSGTDALFLSLKALGVKEGDEVITTSFTFYATVGAIVTAGAKPVFVDIKDDFNIDVSQLESAMTPKTKAIVPVHWSGNPCDCICLENLAKKHCVPIVYDACHAILSEYQSQKIGDFGTTSCFSMHPLKNLNVWGDGGLIVSNDKKIVEQLRLIRNHGLVSRNVCQEFAYNSRLDTIQAVVGQHLLDHHIENITAKRIQHAHYFDQELENIEQIKIPKREVHKKHVYHLYMFTCERRDELKDYLIQNGVDAKVHYPVPMHLQPASSFLNHQKGDFPVSEYTANHCLSLPVHEFITQAQQDQVIELIKTFYKG